MHIAHKVLYEILPKKVDAVLNKNGIKGADVEMVKDYICDNVRPALSSIKFTNEKVYERLNKELLDLEDNICNLIKPNNDNTKCRNIVKDNMKRFYKKLNKYYWISK